MRTVVCPRALLDRLEGLSRSLTNRLWYPMSSPDRRRAPPDVLSWSVASATPGAPVGRPLPCPARHMVLQAATLQCLVSMQYLFVGNLRPSPSPDHELSPRRIHP